MNYINQIKAEFEKWEDQALEVREKAQSEANREARKDRDADDITLLKGLPDNALYDHFEDVIEDNAASDEVKQRASELLRANGINPGAKAYTGLAGQIDGRDLYFALQLDNSDVDMTKRLLVTCHDKLRFSKALGVLAWDGCRWKVEEKDDAPIFRAAQEIVERMNKEPKVARIAHEYGLIENYKVSKKDAQKARDADPDAWVVCHEELVARARSAKSAKVIKSMTDIAFNHLSIETNSLDMKISLLTTPVGTIDLRTGEVLPNSPENLLTKMTPVSVPTRTDKHGRQWVDFDKKMAAVWLKAIDDAFLGDQALIDYVQRLSGYCLTGETKEQKFFFLYGTGSNMKGRYCETLKRLTPEHHAELDIAFMMKQHGNRKQLGGTNEELANLRGARIIHAEESSSDDVLDDAPMKRISGGGDFEVAKKFKSTVRFKPEGKILAEMNHRPRILSQDPAIWRRIVEIPFLAHFADPGDAGYVEGVSKPKNPNLDDDMTAELPHILAWAVLGAMKWYEKRSLAPEPQAIIDARENYKEHTDVLADFIAAACVKGKDHRVRAGFLFEAYKQFCELNSTGRPISSRAFSAALSERGYGHERKGGVIFRNGIKLNVAGQCYRRGQYPDVVTFDYRLGDNALQTAESIDELPNAVKDALMVFSDGKIPNLDQHISTELGVFVRTA